VGIVSADQPLTGDELADIVESLRIVRDGFIVVKALLTASREEIAAADLNGIAAVVNTGYETLDSLIWRLAPEVSS
jgi:hypothetical protein